MLFAVIGGVVGAVLVMVAGSIAPLGAQNEVTDAEFETISCRRLYVVDEYSRLSVGITSEEYGGLIAVRSKQGKGNAGMGVDEHGGFIGVTGKDGNDAVNMGVSKYGGHVGVFGKEDNYARAAISVNEVGNGAVGTWNKNGYRLATLK